MKKIFFLLVCCYLFVGIIGCGQSGKLYLPAPADEHSLTPVEAKNG